MDLGAPQSTAPFAVTQLGVYDLSATKDSQILLVIQRVSSTVHAVDTRFSHAQLLGHPLVA